MKCVVHDIILGHFVLIKLYTFVIIIAVDDEGVEVDHEVNSPENSHNFLRW